MDQDITVSDLANKAKIIFWDFDGVIKDSVQVKVDSFCLLFESYGTDVVGRIKIHNEDNGGMSRFEKFPLYLSWVGEEITDSRIKDLSNQFSELVLSAVLNSEWIPGAENYLRKNFHNQIFILVSATPLVELKFILKKLQLSEVFNDVYGSPTTKESSIMSGLEKFKVLPNEAVMIGDSMADKKAADTCKIPFILKKSEINSKIFDKYMGPSISDLTEI
jgi:phosphoglycolate phosphatase-like HAD superfamily hydrolase